MNHPLYYLAAFLLFVVCPYIVILLVTNSRNEKATWMLRNDKRDGVELLLSPLGYDLHEVPSMSQDDAHDVQFSLISDAVVGLSSSSMLRHLEQAARAHHPQVVIDKLYWDCVALDEETRASRKVLP